MFGFLNGITEIFSQNSQQNIPNVNSQPKEVIPKEIFNQLKYYISLLEHNNKFTSCFFIEVNGNNQNGNSYYLCTSSDFITQKNIESKEKFNIYLGSNYLDSIPIKLNNQQRKIMKSNKANEFIFIQIFPEIDNLPKDKFLTIKKSDLNEYIGMNAKDVFIIGYQNIQRKEISINNCKIENLMENYKMKLNPEENDCLGCSPIFIINQNEIQLKNKFKLIGIRGQYDILKDNSGYLLGQIIESLNELDKTPNQLFNNIMNNIINNDNICNINNEINKNDLNDENNNNNEILQNTIGNDNNNVDTNINTEGMKLLQYYYFYTFDEYKKHVIKFHNLISKYFVSQNLLNFEEQYSALKDYLRKYPIYEATNRKFIYSLQFFKDPKNFERDMPEDIIKNFNKILSSGKLEFIEKFSYFIAGLMLGLHTYGINRKCRFVNDKNRLYKRLNLNYEDIKRFESNKNKIILFKTFLNEITTLEHFQGIVYKNKIDADFVKKNNKFDTQIYFRHLFDDSWEATCFSLSTFLFPEKVFNLFTFFKVVDVDINYDKRQAVVNLENVGIQYILEEIISAMNDQFSLEYNTLDNTMEVV